MLKRPEASRRSSDLSTRENNVNGNAPATLSAASSSHPPRNTDNVRKTCCSSGERRLQEWVKTALKLLCLGDASRAEEARKSRLSLIEPAILSVEKWRTHAAASTIPSGNPATNLQMS